MENRTTFRVRYGETDRMGIVYHTAYIDYFAAGRTEWLREAGLPYRTAFEEKGLYLPVRNVACRYRSSVTYDDIVTVVTTLDLLAPTRLRFAYRITAEDGRTAAEGITEHAFLDGATARPVNIERVHPTLWTHLSGLWTPATSEG